MWQRSSRLSLGLVFLCVIISANVAFVDSSPSSDGEPRGETLSLLDQLTGKSSPSPASSPKPSPSKEETDKTPSPSPKASPDKTPSPSPKASSDKTPSPSPKAPPSPKSSPPSARSPSPKADTPAPAPSPAPSSTRAPPPKTSDSSLGAVSGSPTAEAPADDEDDAAPAAATPTTVPGGTVSDDDPLAEFRISPPAQSVQDEMLRDDPLPADDGKAPSSPPKGWAKLPEDRVISLQLDIKGQFIVPFTKPKAYVVSKALRDSVWLSAGSSAVSVSAVQEYEYLEFPDGVSQTAASTDGTPTPQGATPSPAPASSRRLLSRSLLQVQRSGAVLAVTYRTNSARTSSEISALLHAAASGDLADAITATGVQVSNATLFSVPDVQAAEVFDNPAGNDDSGAFKAWWVAVPVGLALLILPVPLYCCIRCRRRKMREAYDLREAEEAAQRAKSEARFFKTGAEVRRVPTVVIHARAGGQGSPHRMYGGHSPMRSPGLVGPERSYSGMVGMEPSASSIISSVPSVARSTRRPAAPHPAVPRVNLPAHIRYTNPVADLSERSNVSEIQPSGRA